MSLGTSSRGWLSLRPSIAHLAGFTGANLVIGAICVWSQNEAGYPQAMALPGAVAILLVCLGAALMLIGSKSLAPRVRRPLTLR